MKLYLQVNNRLKAASEKIVANYVIKADNKKHMCFNTFNLNTFVHLKYPLGGKGTFKYCKPLKMSTPHEKAQ